MTERTSPDKNADERSSPDPKSRRSGGQRRSKANRFDVGTTHKPAIITLAVGLVVLPTIYLLAHYGSIYLWAAIFSIMLMATRWRYR